MEATDKLRLNSPVPEVQVWEEWVEWVAWVEWEQAWVEQEALVLSIHNLQPFLIHLSSLKLLSECVKTQASIRSSFNRPLSRTLLCSRPSNRTSLPS